MPSDPVVIVGATATGKSALALALAERWSGVEIVSVDSMQVYRGMDIGTAKPTSDELAAVPHHLIDVLEPCDECSLPWFQAEARTALADIAGRSGQALLVGGTGLYHRAVVDGLEIPGHYPDAAADLERDPDTVAMHRRLVELDPVAAARMEPTNRRRVLRALEVTVGSGRPFSSFGPGLVQYADRTWPMVGLAVDRNVLAQRVRDRVHSMVEAGLLAEVVALLAHPGGMSRTARQALGYRELIAHLDGECGLDDAIELITVRTRRFAVRQERWFRRDPRIVWIDAQTPDLVARVADTVGRP